MKTISLLILATVLTLNATAQLSLNSSFEDWTPSGSEPPFDWEEPTGWKSNNAAVEFIGAAITQTDDAYDGNSAVKISTPSIFGETVPGVLVNGNPSVNFSTYSVNFDEAGDSLNGLTNIPVAFDGWYKFSSSTADDKAYVSVAFTKFNDETNQLDTTAFGSAELVLVDNYTSFNFDINNTGTGIDPDNVIVAFYSTNPENPLEGGELIVDLFNFMSIPANVKDIDNRELEVLIYPNPVSTQLQMAFELINADKTIKLYSVYGQEIISFESSQKIESIDFTSLENGIYIVKVFDKFQQLVKTERIVKL